MGDPYLVGLLIVAVVCFVVLMWESDNVRTKQPKFDDPSSILANAPPPPAVTQQECRHPSGFLFLGERRVLGREGDIYYCPHCQERRVITLGGKELASCSAGGEWMEWK